MPPSDLNDRIWLSLKVFFSHEPQIQVLKFVFCTLLGMFARFLYKIVVSIILFSCSLYNALLTVTSTIHVKKTNHHFFPRTEILYRISSWSMRLVPPIPLLYCEIKWGWGTTIFLLSALEYLLAGFESIFCGCNGYDTHLQMNTPSVCSITKWQLPWFSLIYWNCC